MAKKKKLNLKNAKLANVENKLTDKQLSTLISSITQKYVSAVFDDIKDTLDEEYKEAFKYSNYEYLGYKTDLGSIRDIDIMFKQREM